MKIIVDIILFYIISICLARILFAGSVYILAYWDEISLGLGLIMLDIWIIMVMILYVFNILNYISLHPNAVNHAIVIVKAYLSEVLDAL